MNLIYLKQILRNLKKNKINSFVTIFGLATGMAATILLFIYTQHEFSYDRFHKDYSRIYRLNSIIKEDSRESAYPICLRLDDSTFQKRVPEIESMFQIYNGSEIELIKENVHYKKIPFFYADQGIHKVFTLNFIAGNPNDALATNSSLVLTRSVASKIFGSIDILGKTLVDSYSKKVFTVTGVIEDFPENSHLKVGAIAPMNTIPYLNQLGGLEFLTYIKYKENVNVENALKKTVNGYNDLLKQRFSVCGWVLNSFLIKITDLHLKSDFYSKNGYDAPLKKVYVYIALALIVLLIAVINFINLLTVQYEGKAKEIGVQKAIGASRNDIIIHFIGRSIAFSFIALIIATILVEFLIPSFGNVLNRDLVNTYRHNPLLIVGLPILAIVTGILSGIYPALFISKYPPHLAIKGLSNPKRRSVSLTKILVIIQQSIAIFLIASILTIDKQVDYMKNADLGFNAERVIAIDGLNEKLIESYPAIKDALRKIPEIKNIGASSHLIGGGGSGQSISVSGSATPGQFAINEYRVLPGFIETLDFRFIMGRSFDEKIESDKKGLILNEKAIKMLGVSDPLNTELILNGNKMQILGVVKDYHFASLEEGIGPIMLASYSNHLNFIMLKFADGNMKEILQKVENVIKGFDSQYTIEYIDINELYHNKYKQHEQTETLSVYASILSLVLALLGLYALAIFNVQKRTKEIGIRKVNGATRWQVVIILLASYSKQVLISFLIAAPVTFFVMNKWLNGFAYRIKFSPVLLVAAGLLVLCVAILTVFGLSWRVASKNPIKSLRYE